MAKKYYAFCQNRICIEAPLFHTSHPDWEKFETAETETDLSVVCRADNGENPCNGEYLGKKNGASYYRNGNGLVRCLDLGSGYTATARYGDSFAEVSVDEKNFRVMTDERYFWSTVSINRLLLEKDSLLLHASFIGYRGKAILFSAPCGTGKSTQAALWQKHRGAQIINGDKAGISLKEETPLACGVPFCGTSGICLNSNLPLGAIVLLGQAEKNSLRLLSPVQAIQMLACNVYLDFVDPSERIICVDLLTRLVSRIPVYRFDCTPDENAVTVLENGLKDGGVL